jgi:hypothetical protein
MKKGICCVLLPFSTVNIVTESFSRIPGLISFEIYSCFLDSGLSGLCFGKMVYDFTREQKK